MIYKNMRDEIRDNRIAELYLTGDYSMTKIGKQYNISRERVRQVLDRVIGKEAIVAVKNMKKMRIAERLKESYLETLK